MSENEIIDPINPEDVPISENNPEVPGMTQISQVRFHQLWRRRQQRQKAIQKSQKIKRSI